jgi:hypothetical protein
MFNNEENNEGVLTELNEMIAEPVVELSSESDGQRIFAVKDGYSIQRDNRNKEQQDKEEKQSLINIDVTSIDSFFEALADYRTPMTRAFLRERCLYAVLNFANKQDRGDKKESINIAFRDSSLFRSLDDLVHRSVKPKELTNYLMRVKEIDPNLDIDDILTLQRIKLSKSVSVVEEDMEKGYQLALTAKRENNSGEMVDLPRYLAFSIPKLDGFEDRITVKLRLEITCNDDYPSFILHWDRRQVD